jgi:hypothetical protein
MSRGADLSEQIQWWDILDVLDGTPADEHVEQGVQMARECQHPDAQWLAALFPAGVAVTEQRMAEVMLQQGDDARALFFAWRMGTAETVELLLRSAELGFARAQARMSHRAEDDDDEAVGWAQKSAAQGDRFGLFQLGCHYELGKACAEDRAKAIQLFRESAELQEAEAEHRYASVAFGEEDWEHYYWLGRAALHGYGADTFLSFTLVRVYPLFERGELGRALHVVACLLRDNFEAAKRAAFGDDVMAEDVLPMLRVLTLHDAMLDRARAAVRCWSAVGARLGVMKDVRVMIGKMAFEEAWGWSVKREKGQVAPQ